MSALEKIQQSPIQSKLLFAIPIALLLAWLQYPGFIQTDYEIHYSQIERDDLVVVVTAPGTIKPVTSIEVSSQLSGQISEVLVDFNQPVVADQVLARLDSASYRMAVRQAVAEQESAKAQLELSNQGVLRAESELANARAVSQVISARQEGARAREANALRALERIRSLHALNNAPAGDVEQAEGIWLGEQAAVSEQQAQLQVQETAIISASTELEMAKARVNAARSKLAEREAALEKARIELSRTDIRSPIDGLVILRNVSQGQTVAASLQAPVLFTVAENLSSIEVEVAVDEADIGRIEMDQFAVFSVDTFPGKVFRGRVSQIRKAPQRIQSVVTYDVVIKAQNPDEQLLPGMTALVRVAVEDAENALVIPNAALRFTPPEELQLRPPAAQNGTTIWTGDEDNLAPLTIETGITDTEVTELERR